jgi:hypothetical protein
MPYDELTTSALAALRPQLAAFRFIVSSTLERARQVLSSESGPAQVQSSLGDFAKGRIDPARFANIASGAAPLDNAARAAVERAIETLQSIVDAGEDQFVIDVRPGESINERIDERLARFHALFEAATLVETVRRRSYDPQKHGVPVAGRPFSNWSASERKLIPPLVVNIDGTDLDPFLVGPFLDGVARFVLIVKEPCAPAPLARLISPGVFVAQTSDAKVLEKLDGFDGPALVAIMTGNEARFIHDPRRGSTMWQRLEMVRMPDGAVRAPLGSRSVRQQREDLAHLKALVEPPSLPGAPIVAPGIDGSITDPVERLTAWLLDQSSRADVAS